MSGALTGSSITVVTNGEAQACTVTGRVDAATTMTDSVFEGNILAGAAITMTLGTLHGNAWAGADGVGDVTFAGTMVEGCEEQTGPGPKPGKCTDRVPGGGHITIGSDQHGEATFGLHAGTSRLGTLRGQPGYHDHVADVRVMGTCVTAYVVVDATTRSIEGTAAVNGVAGFTCTVVTARSELR